MQCQKLAVTTKPVKSKNLRVSSSVMLSEPLDLKSLKPANSTRAPYLRCDRAEAPNTHLHPVS
jgi:hypothetical protein